MIGWLLAILILGAICGGLYLLAMAGGKAALQRDRRDHLRIVNAARARSKLPPLREDQLPDHPESVPWGEDPRVFALERAAAGHAAVDVDLSAEVAPYVSIILLQAGGVPLTEQALRSAAVRAWSIALPSDNPADDEFVSFKTPPTGTLAAGGFRFTLHDHATPYFRDAAATATTLSDPALREAVRESSGWRGLDLLGQPDGLTKENAYALIAKLAAEIADDRTVGVFLPEFRQLFPWDGRTRAALASPGVVGALRESHMA